MHIIVSKYSNIRHEIKRTCYTTKSISFSLLLFQFAILNRMLKMCRCSGQHRPWLYSWVYTPARLPFCCHFSDYFYLSSLSTSILTHSIRFHHWFPKFEYFNECRYLQNNLLLLTKLVGFWPRPLIPFILVSWFGIMSYTHIHAHKCQVRVSMYTYSLPLYFSLTWHTLCCWILFTSFAILYYLIYVCVSIFCKMHMNRPAQEPHKFR